MIIYAIILSKLYNIYKTIDVDVSQTKMIRIICHETSERGVGGKTDHLVISIWLSILALYQQPCVKCPSTAQCVVVLLLGLTRVQSQRKSAAACLGLVKHAASLTQCDVLNPLQSPGFRTASHLVTMCVTCVGVMSSSMSKC